MRNASTGCSPTASEPSERTGATLRRKMASETRTLPHEPPSSDVCSSDLAYSRSRTVNPVPTTSIISGWTVIMFSICTHFCKTVESKRIHIDTNDSLNVGFHGSEQAEQSVRAGNASAKHRPAAFGAAAYRTDADTERMS